MIPGVSPPCARPRQAEETPDGGRLARAVRTEEAEHATGRNGEVQPGEGGDRTATAPAVVLSEAVDLNDFHHSPASATGRVGSTARLPRSAGVRGSTYPDDPREGVIELLPVHVCPRSVRPAQRWRPGRTSLRSGCDWVAVELPEAHVDDASSGEYKDLGEP